MLGTKRKIRKPYKNIITMVMGIVVGIIVGFIIANASKRKNGNDKSEVYMNVLNNWLLIKLLGGSLETYFKERGMNSVAIYGYGKLGRNLYIDLKNKEVNIKYIIDKRKDSYNSDIEMYSPTDVLPPVDAIIVTPITEMVNIKNDLAKKYNGKIVSLEDVIYECL